MLGIWSWPYHKQYTSLKNLANDKQSNLCGSPVKYGRKKFNNIGPRIVPVVPLGNSGIYLSELFHGPSGSFKVLVLEMLAFIKW